jgi:hypothetical protein
VHHDSDATTPPQGAVLGAVGVHLQLGSTLPQVAADGGRKQDPRGRVVLRVLVLVDGDEARAAVRLTITGTARGLRELLTAMATAVAALDPDPGADPPLVTRPHDWPVTGDPHLDSSTTSGSPVTATAPCDPATRPA